MTALRSSSLSIQRDQRLAASPDRAARMPVGGIMPARSLRTTFSANLRVVAETREVQIELVEQQVRRLQPRVVAGDTVLIDERARLRGFLSGRRGHGVDGSGCLGGWLLPRSRASLRAWTWPWAGSFGQTTKATDSAATQPAIRSLVFKLPHALITRTELIVSTGL